MSDSTFRAVGAMVAGRHQSAVVAALVFCSGLCALVYQVAWLRELRLFSAPRRRRRRPCWRCSWAVSAPAGCCSGRRAERSAEPARLLRWLEIGAAVAAGSPRGPCARCGRLPRGRRHEHARRPGRHAAAAGAHRVVLGVADLPDGGRAAGDRPRGDHRRRGRGRRSLGWLYGFNTLGAVTGAALATFVLLEALGQRKAC